MYEKLTWNLIGRCLPFPAKSLMVRCDIGHCSYILSRSNTDIVVFQTKQIKWDGLQNLIYDFAKRCQYPTQSYVFCHE